MGGERLGRTVKPTKIIFGRFLVSSLYDSFLLSVTQYLWLPSQSLVVRVNLDEVGLGLRQVLSTNCVLKSQDSKGEAALFRSHCPLADAVRSATPGRWQQFYTIMNAPGENLSSPHGISFDVLNASLISPGMQECTGEAYVVPHTNC